MSTSSLVPFAPREVERLRASLRDTGSHAPCPRCSAPLTAVNLFVTTEHRVHGWLYHCPKCDRSIAL